MEYAILKVTHDALGREVKVEITHKSNSYSYLKQGLEFSPEPCSDHEFHLCEHKRGTKYKSFQNGHLYKLKGESND